MSTIYNFGAGPAMLPHEVLLQAQEELIDYQGTGMSIMESSHRSPAYDEVHQEAEANIRSLLNIPDSHAILFLQGGASFQFAMAPMNLRGETQTADYTLSGVWAKKAIAEAKRLGTIHIAADCAADRPTRVPLPSELDLTAGAAYLHLTSNETISGAQWKTFPECDAPIVADMSSDILSRPLPIERFGLIYAGAQKNLGPSGVTLAIIRKDLAEGAPESLPTMLRYQTHIDANSLYNTPPTFGVYLLALVTRWVADQGGVEALDVRNQEKAARLYDAIDASDFYRGTALPEHRSLMNVTFNLPTEDLEANFAKESAAEGMKGLKGHRSVGGIRASIYNAFPAEGIDALVGFMKEFERVNG